jgi:biotin synthase
MELNSVLNKEELTKEEIVFLLSLRGEDEIAMLHKRADEVRKHYCGDDVHLRGIIEFSNNCKQNCPYCGLRISNKKLKRYRMNKDEIIETAKQINDAGIKTIVLQSGEDFWYDEEFISDLISSIKYHLDVAITLSLGERKFNEYISWRKAGADRYLLKHETANPKIYSKLHQKQKLFERIDQILLLKGIGYQIGSGNIIGLPNQKLEDIADDLILCEKLECDMASFSPFIPALDTPFRNIEKASLELTLKTISLARIVLKDAHIPATTALGVLDETGRIKGLQAGANVIMPNYTPHPYKENYKIYDGKICISESTIACGSCLRVMIESLGRKVAVDRGDSLKFIAVN